jgi:hypothetical protein
MARRALSVSAAALWAAGAAAQGFPDSAAAVFPPVTDGATPPTVDSAPLGSTGPGAAGLLPPAMTGLPASLWRGSEPDRLTALIATAEPTLPALAALMRTLMLAEADPPAGGDGVAHLGARLDWLIAHGAVDEALAVVEIAGTGHPDLFSRWADLTLLLGRTDAPCRTLAGRPGLSDAVDLRIFCIARSGDWSRAALVLGSARVLGTLAPRQVDLLERFLDPELAEERPQIAPPARPTPLEFRLFEAIGEPLPTAPLPLPFAVLDLSGTAGWRAEIVAAERLARAGALPANRLLGLYTRQRPAASGGVWDRVAAFQALEDALTTGGGGAVGPALERAWPQMASARLLVPFATIFAPRLVDTPLEGRAARMARIAGFLAPGAEALATRIAADDPQTAFLSAIARGAVPPAPPPGLLHARGVALGFADTPPTAGLDATIGEARLGETVLEAIALFERGAAGDDAALGEALAILRGLGLERVARAAALQVMLLDTEGARR